MTARQAPRRGQRRGFEAVGMADSIQSDEYSMSLGAYAESTCSAMQSCINENIWTSW